MKSVAIVCWKSREEELHMMRMVKNAGMKLNGTKLKLAYKTEGGGYGIFCWANKYAKLLTDPTTTFPAFCYTITTIVSQLLCLSVCRFFDSAVNHS